MMPYFFWGSGMWIFPIIGIIGIIVILFIVFMIFGRVGFMGGCGGNGYDRHYHDDDRHYSRSESAMDILNKRYAKGEITKEEFERMKKDIAG